MTSYDDAEDYAGLASAILTTERRVWIAGRVRDLRAACTAQEAHALIEGLTDTEVAQVLALLTPEEAAALAAALKGES